MATKVELAQLKEQQVVAQRQLRQASMGGSRSFGGAGGGGGGLSLSGAGRSTSSLGHAE